MKNIEPNISVAQSISSEMNSVFSVNGHRFISHVINGSWGISMLFMEITGKAFCRAFWYHDDKTTIYLDFLSVDERLRKQGFGTKLQELREDIGIRLGFSNSCLWVKKDSWMRKWYQRRGYEDWQDYDGEKECIWMKKSLQ